MDQLGSHVILAAVCLGAVSQMGAPIAAEVPEMCSGSEATIRCVERNFDVMSHRHGDRFWAILNEAARNLRERAPQGQECDSTGKMVQFLSLARVRPVSAEFVEFYSQQIEQLCLGAAPCFRNASKFLDEDGRAALRSMLANPVFVDPAPLESAKCIAGPDSKSKKK
jgi:hypothetical protein